MRLLLYFLQSVICSALYPSVSISAWNSIQNAKNGGNATPLTSQLLTSPLSLLDQDVWNNGSSERVDHFEQTMRTIFGHLNGKAKCMFDMTSIFTSALCQFHSSSPICQALKVEGVSSMSHLLLDSWPRIPSGLNRKGPFFLLGDFDECMDVYETNDVHYCTIETQLTTQMHTEIPFTVGLCLPSSCSSVVLEKLSKPLFNYVARSSSLIGQKLEMKLTKMHCQTEDKDWSSIKPLMTAVFSVMLCLLAMGTLVDYSIQNGLKEGNGMYCRTGAGSDYEALSVVKEMRPVQGHYQPPSIALTYKSMPSLRQSLSMTTILIEVLCSFSLRISFSHLFRNTAVELPSINGIKILSALWVIFGHCCLFSLPYMDTIRPLSKSLTSSWLSSILLNSSLAVDSFLFISGTVAAYTYRKRLLFRPKHHLSVGGRVLRVMRFYFHRAFRLWPALGLTAIFFSFFYNHLGDGPMWNTNGIFGTQCDSKSLLPHLFFLSNWFPSHCLPWLWHIAVDFQLYLISPLIFFLLHRHRRTAYMLCSLLIAGSILYRITVFYMYKLPANMFVGILRDRKFEEGETSFRLLYGSPISRCPPFIIGILTGWNVCRRSWNVVSFQRGTVLKIIMIAFLIYALFAPFSEEGLMSYFHAVFHRLLWAVGLCVLIWLCEYKQLSSVSYLLSSPRLLPFSRLSFGVYLSHEPILLYLIWTSRQAHSPHSFMFFLLLTLLTTVLSLIAALLLAVSIEIPILTMEKRLFKRTETKFNRRTKEEGERVTARIDAVVGQEVDFLDKTKYWLQNTESPYKQLYTGLKYKHENALQFGNDFMSQKTSSSSSGSKICSELADPSELEEVFLNSKRS